MSALRNGVFFMLILAAAGSRAQTPTADRQMRVALFAERTTKQVMLMAARGTCTVWADGVRKGEVKPNDGLRIEVDGKGLVARTLGFTVHATRIEVLPSGTSGFRMRPLDRKEAEKKYPGSLQVTNVGGRLLLIDRMPLEEYTAGVVSAEAGKEHHQEYYKLQAVSCRTYALTNMRKHAADGYELCDGVHCQVFRGANRNDSIQQAVDATHGLVIVDAEIRLIHATFHSNCGGETMNAEDLWGKAQPYLRSRVDTFCLHAPHALWQKSMPRSEWLGYLNKRFSFTPKNDAQLDAVLEYHPTCRGLYLGDLAPMLPLKHIREDLNLRSTLFAVTTDGDKVTLAGRGFGHGVGLCQEGAMAMAREGYSYTDILHHYYTNVHLVDLATIDFFRDDDELPGPGGGPRGR